MGKRFIQRTEAEVKEFSWEVEAKETEIQEMRLKHVRANAAVCKIQDAPLSVPHGGSRGKW